jgi:hypothetical protein
VEKSGSNPSDCAFMRLSTARATHAFLFRVWISSAQSDDPRPGARKMSVVFSVARSATRSCRGSFVMGDDIARVGKVRLYRAVFRSRRMIVVPEKNCPGT